MYIKIIDYPSLIKESSLTNEEQTKLIEVEKYIKDNIKPLNSEYTKIIDENFWDLI